MEERIQIREVEVAPEERRAIYVISEKGPFRLLNMIIPDDVAKNFVIGDIQVGRNSQFMSPDYVPADYFAERGELEDLITDTLPRGGTIKIWVVNTSPSPAKFSAVLRGLLETDQPNKHPPIQNRVIMGLGVQMIQPGTTHTIKTKTQVFFAPNYLVPTRDLGVSVKSIRIAGVELPMTPEHPSLITFPPTALNLDDWLVVEVENKTSDSVRFGGVVVGACARR